MTTNECGNFTERISRLFNIVSYIVNIDQKHFSVVGFKVSAIFLSTKEVQRTTEFHCFLFEYAFLTN